MTNQVIDKQFLLNDQQVMEFVVCGYHLVELPLPRSFHDQIAAQATTATHGLGNEVYDTIPMLREVYEHPLLQGALASLLGPDYTMNPHRHLHTIRPKTMWSQGWHQDGTNVRDREVWTCLAMYYPQEVSADMGPTAILPGSHIRNAPTDRMANYTNIRGSKFLTVKAGTVAITHYDLWHAGTLNRSGTPRHMFKFLFDRQSVPTKPSWNHDPANGHQVAGSRVSAMVGGTGSYNSDYYKEWELRKEMWLWLCGLDCTVPPGSFRNMLNQDALLPMSRKTISPR